MKSQNSMAYKRKKRPLLHLDGSDVASDPYQQFRKWFEEAVRARVAEPTAMVLATASRTGKPSARVVLLKGADRRGFMFFTNYQSKKGKELTRNPHAAIVFFWFELDRQVRIEGTVRKVSSRESNSYFSTRPKESRLSAWASHQSRVIGTRAELEKRFRDYAAKFNGREIPRPDYWGGYRLIANKFEFWQGRESRLHDRIAYQKRGRKWDVTRLAP